MSDTSRRRARFCETEIGVEARCTKCGDYWPADAEFFYLDRDGRPHSWCKACYIAERIARGTSQRTGSGSCRDRVRAA